MEWFGRTSHLTLGSPFLWPSLVPCHPSCQDLTVPWSSPPQAWHSELMERGWKLGWWDLLQIHFNISRSIAFFILFFFLFYFTFYYPLCILVKTIKPKSHSCYSLQTASPCFSEKAYITGFLNLIPHHPKTSLCLHSFCSLSLLGQLNTSFFSSPK